MNTTRARAANAVILAAAAACALVLAYGASRSDIFFRGPTIYIAYLLPAVLLLALLGSFLAGQNFRNVLALTLVPVGSGLLATESILAVAAHRRSAVKSKVGFDGREQSVVVAAYRRRGIDAVPALAPLAFNYWRDTTTMSLPVYPLAGVSHTTTVFCNESGAYLTYLSDRHGFNNPDAVWNQRNIDVAAVGDSYVQGACVPSGSDAVSVVREFLPRTLNLGVWGAGPLSTLAVIQEYAALRRPRVVLFFFFEGNDFHDLRNERESALMRRYLDGGIQGLGTRQSTVDSTWMRLWRRPEEAAQGPTMLQKTLSIVRLVRLREALGLAMTPSYDPVFARTLTRSRMVVQKWGGELMLVYLPAYRRYHPTVPFVTGASSLASTHDSVLAAAARASVPVIDVTRHFESVQARSNMWYSPHSHYSERGYRAVGEAVLRALAERRAVVGR